VIVGNVYRIRCESRAVCLAGRTASVVAPSIQVNHATSRPWREAFRSRRVAPHLCDEFVR